MSETMLGTDASSSNRDMSLTSRPREKKQGLSPKQYGPSLNAWENKALGMRGWSRAEAVC